MYIVLCLLVDLMDFNVHCSYMLNQFNLVNQEEQALAHTV